MITHTLVLAIACVAPQKAGSFSEGLQAAKATGHPLIVLAHGSDWCQHGARWKADVWDVEGTVSEVIFADVDIRESPTETDTQRNAGFDPKWVRTYPSLLAFAPDGTRLGTRAGATLPRSPRDGSAVLRQFVADATARIVLLAAAEAAKASGDAAAEVAAWHAMLEQELDVPANVLARLAEIDPGDPSGIRRRASFGPFHQFVARATKDGQEGRGQEAIDRLQAMLDEGVYTPPQEAWIHAAMGSAYRYWDGHDAQARACFERAHRVAPESTGGMAARRLAMQLYGDPSLELGWQPRHLRTEPVQWLITDLPSPMQRGTWTVRLEHTRGRHGIDISEVRVLDGKRTIVTDAHMGFAGGSPRDNVYTLQLLWDVAQPHLRITAAGAGGTNGHGRIVLERAGD